MGHFDDKDYKKNKSGPVSLRWDVFMLFCCILVCIIQIFYDSFTFCDSVLVTLLYLRLTMTHQCCVTCRVAFFMLITIAFSLVTCLTTAMPRVLQKWGIAW